MKDAINVQYGSESRVDEILADIQRGAVSAASSGNINLVGHVLAPLAALLVKLSRDSADATARIERLSRNLFATVIALVIVTLVLFAREANHLYEKGYRIKPQALASK